MFYTVAGKKIAVARIFIQKRYWRHARESPAIDVCKMLLAETASLSIYDPRVAREQIYTEIGKDAINRILIEDDVYVACAGAHAIAILTEWEEFKKLDFERIYASMMRPAFVFDGRSILTGSELERIGFQYWGIGRSFS